MIIILLLIIIAILAPVFFFGSIAVGVGAIAWILSEPIFWIILIVAIGVSIPIAKKQRDEAEQEAKKLKETEKRVSVFNGLGKSLRISLSSPNVDAIRGHLDNSQFATTECRESDLVAVLNVMGSAGYHPTLSPTQMQASEITNEILKSQEQKGEYKQAVRIKQTYKIVDEEAEPLTED